MFLSINQLTAPIVEPLTLDQLKQQCNVDSTFTNDDTLIASYGVAARQYAEEYTRRAFFNQQWLLTLDHFPTYLQTATVNPAVRRDWVYYSGIWNGMTIALPKSAIAIGSITYLDTTGTQQTLSPANYTADFTSTPARIVPAPGLYWPLSTVYVPGSVKITYTGASYVQQFTESFTVPSSPPMLQYEPDNAPVTAITSFVDSNDNPVEYTLTDGVLYFPSEYIGETLTLTYYAGTTFPQAIAQAMLLLVSHWYVNRETASPMKLTEIPFGVTALLDMYRITVLDYEAIV